MRRFFTLFAALLLTSPGVLTSQEISPSPDPISTPPIILPVVPVLVEPETPPEPIPSPQVVATLTMDQWYVVESTRELIALTSPIGIAAVESTAGPIKVRGIFADGTGKVETRAYRSPYVYFITGVSPGKTELILIPAGVSIETDIVRQVLTVSGVGPIPPPGPTPPGPLPPGPTPEPTPDPTPQPVTSFRVIFVKESGSTLTAEQTAIPGAKSIRDYLNAKTTPEGGATGWREYDPQQTTANEQPTMKALWAAVQPKLLPSPCMVVEVNGHATVMPLPADTAEALTILQKHGGR